MPATPPVLHQRYRWLTLSLLALIAVIVLSTFRQYGMSWDEYYRFNSGDAKLKYYQNLLSGDEANAGVDHYPGLFDLTLAALHPWSPWDRITTGHFMSSLFGLAAVAGVAMTARLLGGWRAAFWATLFIITLPRFYGHICFNPKDIPFAATYIWGLFFLTKYVCQLPSPKWIPTIALGIAFGTCMSMRIGGLILFCYWLMALVIASMVAIVRNRQQPAASSQEAGTPRLQAVGKIALQFITAAAIAALLLMFWWPYAHGNLFNATANTLGKITAWQAGGSKWQLYVLFDGHYYKDSELPFYYWPWMFLIITPLFHLLLIVIGIAKAIPLFARRLKTIGHINPSLLALFMLVFASVFPVAFVIASGAHVFDGIRHLLFVLTPLAACVGILLGQLLSTVSYRWAPALLFILMTLPVWSMVRLHPYQYIFYNYAVGGVEQAASHYETDYWGTSNRAAVEALVTYLKEKDARFTDKQYLIAVSNGSWLSSSYFPENLAITAQPEIADFFIGNTRMQGHEAMDGDTIIEIKAGDTLLCVVKDRRAQKQAFLEQMMQSHNKKTSVKATP